MAKYTLNYKHTYLDIYLEPSTRISLIDMYGKEAECVEALKESFEEMQYETALDGTETYEMINIVKVLEEA